jgi:hypothetical protein
VSKVRIKTGKANGACSADPKSASALRRMLGLRTLLEIAPRQAAAREGVMHERMFPVQGGPQISWSTAEQAYEVYSHCYGREQTLERLAERGGFWVNEVELFLRVRQQPQARWRDLVYGGSRG